MRQDEVNLQLVLLCPGLLVDLVLLLLLPFCCVVWGLFGRLVKVSFLAVSEQREV